MDANSSPAPQGQIKPQPTGISSVVAGLFLAGEAGVGLLALPRAIVSIGQRKKKSSQVDFAGDHEVFENYLFYSSRSSGWPGYLLVILCLTMDAYGIVLLGRCRLILQDQWPDEFAGHVRHPFTCIATKAGGHGVR